jgi:hypothetical protein
VVITCPENIFENRKNQNEKGKFYLSNSILFDLDILLSVETTKSLNFEELFELKILNIHPRISNFENF